MEFINPNWHVILIHYPIGLLTIGLIVEIISVFKPKGGFRAAGRWMIAIGAVLAIPTLTSGLYAFRDTVSNDPIMMGEHWHDLAHDSPWNPTQWEFMRRHIWSTSIGSGIALLVVLLWLANPDRIRRKLYWLLLPALIASCAFIGIGAWHSGEAVYRYGTAVQRDNPNPPSEGSRHDVDYYAPPLQVHVILAGMAVAAAVVAMALMLRRWERPAVKPLSDVDAAAEREALAAQRLYDPLTEDPARDRTSAVRQSIGPYGEEELAVAQPPKVYPGRFYLGATVLALTAAFFGAWSTAGDLTKDSFGNLLHEVREPDHRRLLLHSVWGVGIILLPLLLGFTVRFARRQRMVPLILTLLLLAAIGLQTWMGVLILFDGQEGPVMRFAPAEAASEADHAGETAATTPSSGRRSATTPATLPAALSPATTRSSTAPAP